MKYITRTISGWNVTVTYKLPTEDSETTSVFYDNGTPPHVVRSIKRYMLNKLNVDSFRIDTIERVDKKYRMSVVDFMSNAEEIK